MNTLEILEIIKDTESPLKRQLLMVGLITRLLEEKGKDDFVSLGYRRRKVKIIPTK